MFNSSIPVDSYLQNVSTSHPCGVIKQIAVLEKKVEFLLG